jgi:rod shape determining protein RodA
VSFGDEGGFRARDRFDWPLFITAALIAVIGIVNLYSATSVARLTLQDLYLNQVYWLVAGGIVAVALAAIDYRHIQRFSYPAYAVGVILLILVFVFGKDIRGSSRWVFGIQPSEPMKIFLVFALARFLHDDPKAEGRTLRDYFIPALITGVPVLLVLKQPDLGTGLILSLIFVAIVGLTKFRWKSLAILVAILSIVFPLMWKYGLKDYQRKRVTTFLNPEEDIRGAGWHAHHARIAIGNGGLFGQGYMKGTQNQHLFIPDQHTDFPFPVFAEEWGFVGCLVLLSLYAFLVLWSVRIASQARDRYGAVLAIGSGAVIFWHTFFNVGMVTGVLPVVGVTLPMFSYGGSSMMTILVSLGMLMNVSMRRASFSTRHAPLRFF